MKVSSLRKTKSNVEIAFSSPLSVGNDSTHCPEFTTLEWYEAWVGMKETMGRLETMLSRMFIENCSLTESHHGMNWFPPYGMIEVVPFLEDTLKIAFDMSDPEKLRAQLGGKEEDKDVPLGDLWERAIKKHIYPVCKDPTFVAYHPDCMAPLAKHTGHVALKFELICGGGLELADGWVEQNDPAKQRTAFFTQTPNKQLTVGEEQFIRVLEDGLPPTGGCGVGIDRLVMLLTGKKHLREVQAFPQDIEE